MRNNNEIFINDDSAVYFATNANHYFINDKSQDLVDLYANIKSADNFILFQTLSEIDNYWKSIDNIFYTNRERFFKTYIEFRSFEKK